jgi:hypothetical protein
MDYEAREAYLDRLANDVGDEPFDWEDDLLEDDLDILMRECDYVED